MLDQIPLAIVNRFGMCVTKRVMPAWGGYIYNSLSWNNKSASVQKRAHLRTHNAEYTHGLCSEVCWALL